MPMTTEQTLERFHQIQAAARKLRAEREQTFDGLTRAQMKVMTLAEINAAQKAWRRVQYLEQDVPLQRVPPTIRTTSLTQTERSKNQTLKYPTGFTRSHGT